MKCGSSSSSSSCFCNNCGQTGHVYNLCKNPIMSNGVIAFRFRPDSGGGGDGVEYLTIRRQNTLGYIDFVRGKYNFQSKKYLSHMFRQMTTKEKAILQSGNFQYVWDRIWNLQEDEEEEQHLVAATAAPATAPTVEPPPPPPPHEEDDEEEFLFEEEEDEEEEAEIVVLEEAFVPAKAAAPAAAAAAASTPVAAAAVSSTSSSTYNQKRRYRTEENVSRDKYALLLRGEFEDRVTGQGFYNLASLVADSERKDPTWIEAEWGFPKGRREAGESDYNCAVREFTEETGYSGTALRKIKNILPYEEIFTGSNYKSYKHKYYVMYMDYKDSVDPANCRFRPNNEISSVQWKSFDACMNDIRFYNVEKKDVLRQIHEAVVQFGLYEIIM